MLKELSDMEDVGLYAVASTFALGVGILTRAFAQAWNPFAYSIMNDKNAGEIYSNVGDIFSFIGCLACSLLALCSPILFWIFTSKAEYYAAASLVGLLTFGSLFHGVRGVCHRQKICPGGSLYCVRSCDQSDLELHTDSSFGQLGRSHRNSDCLGKRCGLSLYRQLKKYPVFLFLQ